MCSSEGTERFRGGQQSFQKQTRHIGERVIEVVF